MAQLLTLSTEEQETLLEKIEVDNVPAQKLVKKLAKYIGAYDLNKKEGYKYSRDGFDITAIVMSNEAETLKVIYTNTNGEESVSGSLIVEEKGKKILRSYEIVDEAVVKTFEKEIDDAYIEEVKKASKKQEIPELVNRQDILEQAECIYGHWCGPGCSGPYMPIDAVDNCCKKHDNCYGSRGYFACSCDNELQNCLRPYIGIGGSGWALVISQWFYMQPCNPFA